MAIIRYIFLILALDWVLPKGIANAQTYVHPAKSGPLIQSFSKTEFALYRGDRVRLKVQATGPDLIYRWMRSSGILCDEASCLIDTNEWGFGRHNISFVVFNQFGSLFLRYNITILNPPLGYKPSELEAPLIEEQKKVEQVSWVDFIVFSQGGQGYSYHGSKVQVIGQESRILDWNEILRAQKDSYLRFGRPREESHMLFDSGVVHLGQSSPKRRVMVLARGSLRSRQLNGEMPQYSILVGEGATQDGSQFTGSSWLQVDGDSISDFAIIRSETGDEEDEIEQESAESSKNLSQAESVSIQVYQGTLRVFLHSGKLGEGEAWFVPAGFEIEIEKPNTSEDQIQKPKVEIIPLRVRKMNRILKETSPEYQFASGLDRKLDGWMLVPPKDRSNSFKKAISKAQENLHERKFFEALEELRPHWKTHQNDKRLRTVAAEIFARLGWYDQVLSIYGGSTPNDDQADYRTLVYLGILELLESRWEKALQTLSFAKNKIYTILGKTPDPWEVGLLEYYLGYAAYRAGEYLNAEKAFTETEENKSIPVYIRDSAEGLKRQSKAHKIWDLNFGLGLGFDSNVMRTDDEDLKVFRDGKFVKNRSWSLISSAHTSAWAYRNLDGYIGVKFNFRRVDYAESKLKEVAPLDQELGIAMAFRMGLDEITKDSWFEFGSEAFMGMRYVGEERALDYMRAGVILGSPRFYNLYGRLDKKLCLDPLPLRDDYFDPELEELSGPGDRGRRITSVGIGIEPYRIPQFNLGLKFSQDRVDFGDKNLDSLSYRQIQSEAYGNFVFPRKIFSSVKITQSSRDFSDGEINRDNKTLGLNLGLGIKDILYLTHRLSLSFAKRDASQPSLKYRRNFYEYMATVDF
jgi:tetratricopeptide (TPR) repeat protein